MNAPYITILGFGFCGLSIFLGLFYALRNGLKEDGYLFLYLMLCLLSVELFYKTLIHSQFIYSFVNLYISSRFFNLLLYPIFLFFVYSVTHPKFQLRLPHWGLLLFVLGYTIFNYAPALSLNSAEKLNNLNLFYSDTRPGAYNYWVNRKTLLQGTIIPLLFVGIIVYEFFIFRKKMGTGRKKTLLHILLMVILLFFLFHQFSNLIYKKLEIATGISMIEWPVDIIFLSLIIALLSTVALMVNSGVRFLPPSKYAASPLLEMQYEAILLKVSKVMKEKALYKQTDLTLQLLAKEINSNPSYLSQAINQGLDQRFNDYLNQIRVEEAQQQLLSSKNRHLTIEAIAELCGFQSKSTFFRAFKKSTGMTPKQFIQHKKSSN